MVSKMTQLANFFVFIGICFISIIWMVTADNNIKEVDSTTNTQRIELTKDQLLALQDFYKKKNTTLNNTEVQKIQDKDILLIQKGQEVIKNFKVFIKEKKVKEGTTLQIRMLPVNSKMFFKEEDINNLLQFLIYSYKTDDIQSMAFFITQSNEMCEGKRIKGKSKFEIQCRNYSE